MTKGNPWLPFGTGPEADVRLLCLPHAGAGAGAYRRWGQGLPPEIAVCPVQPPGRERRQAEAPFTSVEPLAKELATVIADTVRAPYALLGHSTGALCAFETLRELRRNGGPPPVHLFVSGRCAPQIPVAGRDLAGMDLTELAALLRRLGGTPEEVLAEPELLALMRPLLAADFSVNEGYAHVAEPPLDVPLTAFAGVDDPGADVAATEPWAVQTAREFALHALPGGHFALFDSAAEVHSHIAAALSPHRGN
ncbi:thioesterase domain-containing protein [Streptomyces sp. NPDC035033]|uniref:thioesterase II family protein n=1 Tax=Streptomyces sp. NPDC035033 TaxID=3155368 RepID=UPI00340EDFB5